MNIGDVVQIGKVPRYLDKYHGMIGFIIDRGTPTYNYLVYFPDKSGLAQLFLKKELTPVVHSDIIEKMKVEYIKYLLTK